MKNKKLNTEQSTRDRGGRPVDLAGIGSRIEYIANKTGGKRSLSKRTGIHETQIYRYINETSTPGAEHLALLARAGDVRADWLLTGSDNIRENRPAYAAGLDQELLQTVLHAVDEALSETQRILAPAKKAELASLLYSMYVDTGAAPDKGKVIRLLKSVA